MPRFYGALDQGKAPLAKAYLVTEDDRIRRETIKRVMCDLSLNFRKISEQFGIDFFQYFAREIAALSPMEQDGLIRFTQFGFEVTPIGRLLIRNVAMQFDGYYQTEPQKRFSKTI